MNSKPFYQSSTIIFSSAAIVLEAANYFKPFVPASWGHGVAFAVAVATFLLRLKTTVPVTLGK